MTGNATIPFPTAPPDAASAARRIAQLETALMRRNEQLEQLQAQLDAVQSGAAWKAARLYHKLFERLLPLHSRRRRTVRSLMRAGLRAVQGATGFNPKRLTHSDPQTTLALDLFQYRAWIGKHEPTAADLAAQRKTAFARRPLVSVVVPVYNTPRPFLTAMVESVLAQTYPRWELCLADGASPTADVAATLATFAARDPRIRVQRLAQNGGIVGNTNAALALAAGDYVAFLDHDDTLAPFALHALVAAVNKQPDADFLYSDEDKLDAAGGRVDPCFKPGWSPDTLRSHNYVCHLLALKRDLLLGLGGLRDGFDGAQDYDLVLRASERARRIVHVPQVLYHWRMHPQSTAADTNSKAYLVDAGKLALAEHLERCRTPASVHPAEPVGTYRVCYHLPRQPLVSILIPNRDSVELFARLVDRIAASSYANYEVLVLENGSADPETHAHYRRLEAKLPVCVVPWERPFNYAAINNHGATLARGELLLFLNNDVEPICEDWLEGMVKHALRPEVGAVGAKLLYSDGTVQHGGIVIGMGGVAGHAHLRFPGDAAGYMDRLRITHNCSAVTGACLMTRREVFERVGGFDERFVLSFNDVDLCLQTLALGYRVLWTPDATLYHLESKTRGYEDDNAKLARFEREYKLFQAKWAAFLAKGDPYYNPNFRLDRADYALRA